MNKSQNADSRAITGSNIKGRTINWPMILVGFLILAIISAGVYIKFATVSYDDTYKSAKSSLEKQDYKTAYTLLERIQNDSKAKADYKFYGDIARASYMSGDKQAAKKYADTGIELYKKAKNKDSTVGVLFNDVVTDSYYGDTSSAQPNLKDGDANGVIQQ